ncbi:MAG: TraB/GumN family protein [Cytophagaceae bacterium]
MKKTQLWILFFLLPFSVKAQYPSLLWEITGNNLSKPSYLFGTMHVNDKRVFNFSDSLLLAFDSSKAFAGELLLDQKNINGQELASIILMPKDTTLKMLIGKKNYRKVKKKAKNSLGVFAMFINRIKPIYTYFVLTEGKQEKKDNSPVLDSWLQTKAKEEGKNVIGIETPMEQIKALDKISLKEQANLLLESINNEDVSDKALEDEMLDLYISGNLDAVYSFFRRFQMPDGFTRSVVINRNHVMAERIMKIIQEQPTFIAVGAAHLPGEEGVIELLRTQGYQLRPVQCRK